MLRAPPNHCRVLHLHLVETHGLSSDLVASCRGHLATSGVGKGWQAHGEHHTPDVLCLNDYLFILLNIIFSAVGLAFHLANLGCRAT
jgi:hypothetical protein